MKKHFVLVISGIFVLLQTVAIGAAEKSYQASAIVFMEGGVKPGPLDPKKIWIAVTPKLVPQVFSAIIDLFADTGSGPRIIGTGSCGFVNLTASAPKIPSIYNGVSCNKFVPPNDTPSDGVVRIPDGAKITAGVRASYPLFEAKVTFPNGEPNETILRGALTVPFLNEVQVLPNSRQQQCPRTKFRISPTKPLGKDKRLVFHTYMIDNPGNKTGLINGKSICFSVTPQGAGVIGLALRGAVYRHKKGKQVLVGAFQCEVIKLKDEVKEGAELMINDASCSPSPPNAKFFNGQKLRALISASFSTRYDDKIYDAIVPITPYFPTARAN